MNSMQYRQPKANQEVSNTNHFGSVSDTLGRLASTKNCELLKLCFSRGQVQNILETNLVILPRCMQIQILFTIQYLLTATRTSRFSSLSAMATSMETCSDAVTMAMTSSATLLLTTFIQLVDAVTSLRSG